MPTMFAMFTMLVTMFLILFSLFPLLFLILAMLLILGHLDVIVVVIALCCCRHAHHGGCEVQCAAANCCGSHGHSRRHIHGLRCVQCVHHHHFVVVVGLFALFSFWRSQFGLLCMRACVCVLLLSLSLFHYFVGCKPSLLCTCFDCSLASILFCAL